MSEHILQLTVSPDFSPDHIAGWYVFNTWLQRQLGVRIHLELYEDFEAQRRAIAADQVDLIYANPYDASMLVRDKGFVAVAAPAGRPDEAVIAVNADSSIQGVQDLRPGTRVVQTCDPDVNLLGMIMLEPADLKADNVVTSTVSSYVLVAKHLMLGRADCGFFLQEAYEGLSAPVRRQLRPLVTSQISVVRHVLLAGPRFAPHLPQLVDLLLRLDATRPEDQRLLEALNIQGWERQEHEDTEFMIDLMNALMR